MYKLKNPYFLAMGILGLLVSSIYLGTMILFRGNLDFRWFFAIISGVPGVILFGKAFQKES